MFQLTKEESEYLLRSQFVTLDDAYESSLEQEKSKRGKHLKYMPYAFTEQGIAMLSSVLNSERAIEINILIMRAFVKLREVLSTHKELVSKFRELEHKVGSHDKDIHLIFQVIWELMSDRGKGKKIGFLK